MNPSIQKAGHTRCFPAVERRAAVVLAIAGFATVRFAVFIRTTRRDSRPRPDFKPHMSILSGFNPVSRVHEKPLRTTDEPTTTAHSRVVALHGSNARGTAVSRCIRKTATDSTRVVAGGTGPRTQARKRRPLNQAGSRFTELRIGSRPMAGNLR